MKKFFGALAVSAALVGSSYAANPFNDVPRGHWAYDAIDKVVDAGMMKGYKNGMFEGQSTVNRYEMAIIISRLLDKLEGKTVGTDVRRTMDRLGEEFMDELDLIGARLTALENAFHEHVSEVNNKPMGSHDGFVFGGESRVRYENRNIDYAGNLKDSNSRFVHRSFLTVDKKVDRADIHVSLRHNGTFGDRAVAGLNNNAALDNEFEVDQAYAAIKVTDESTLLLGRMAAHFGEGRIIGRKKWSNTPESFDGWLFASKASDFDYNVFSLKLANTGAVLGSANVAGNEIELHGLNLDFADVFDGKLHAFYYTAPGFGGLGASLDVYGLDWNMSKDEFHYKLAYAKNGGDNGLAGAANVDNDGDMLNIEVAYDLDEDSQIGVDYDVTSGDNATTAGQNETFQAIMAKRHCFRGSADLFGEGNVEDLSIFYTKKMNERNALKVSYHMMKLEDDSTRVANLMNMPSVAAATANAAGRFDDDLGTEIDLEWTHKLSKDIKINLGYSMFSAGDYFTANTVGTTSPDVNFGWVSTSIKF